MLASFRGGCTFRLSIPFKPAKYGIKIWWMCDADKFYPYNGQMYCGQLPNEQRETGQPKRVILDLSQPLFGIGRNIFSDIFYQHGTVDRTETTSPQLSWDCQEEQTWGSWRVFTIRGRQVHSSLFCHTNTGVLCPESGQVRVPDVVITFRSSDISSFTTQANHTHEEYNSQKWGVDVMDAMVGHYTTWRATRRWPVRLFMVMIDAGALADFVIN